MAASLLAAVFGVMLGVGAALLWRAVSTRVRPVEFWPAVANLTRVLTAAGDDREFLRQYGRLLGLLVRYLGRQVLVLGLSFLPVTLFVMMAAPPKDYPLIGDGMLFWHGVSGPELSFYLALCVASAAGMIFLPLRRV